MDILKSLGHPEEIYNLFKYKLGGCRAVMPKLDYSSCPRMAGVVGKSSVSFSVLKRYMSLRSSGASPRPVLALRGAASSLMRIPRAPPPTRAHPHPGLTVCFSGQESMSDSLRTCYAYLNQTSRSFAAVIQALDGELRHAVCIFYLVLRALDTLEDDMSLSAERKIPLLTHFHTCLYQPEWSFRESREKHRRVLEDFPTISVEFRSLGQQYREVISDVCRRMGEGMAEFLEKKINSMKEWDKYCHYVAGLVGVGLSRLFSASHLEDPEIGSDEELANSMGLFLQKTNIIRDYLEDQQEGRAFWPQEAWSQFSSRLEDFSDPLHLSSALSCLNLLVTDALRHLPDVIKYLSRLRNQSVFNFCAIPQVMAIATLSACYNNPQVFEGVVKIRKGQAVTLMMQATNISNVQSIVSQYTQQIQQKVPASDPSREQTLCVLNAIQEKTTCDLPSQTHSQTHAHSFSPLCVSAAGMLLAALSWQLLNTASDTHTESGR
ncbi:hypothetical protein DNTS_004240 [Danionella cerebrum]|uniref:Squalene synthase n=1 Tax=Danionella cerebrum TaxID=2873325 RepID=A0A553Q9Z9_9TELE|nr:hypothetical protein DNTS_004240 [Danionella translucida]